MPTYFVIIPNEAIFYVEARNERLARKIAREQYHKQRLPKGTTLVRVDRAYYE